MEHLIFILWDLHFYFFAVQLYGHYSIKSGGLLQKKVSSAGKNSPTGSAVAKLAYFSRESQFFIIQSAKHIYIFWAIICQKNASK